MEQVCTDDLTTCEESMYDPMGCEVNQQPIECAADQVPCDNYDYRVRCLL